MQKSKKLGELPINKLLISYSLPAIIAMIVNSIYNIVDRIFISNYVGEDALAGLVIAFPVMLSIFAFAGLIGIGGAALVSIKLGEQNHEDANELFGNMLSLSILFAFVVGIFVLFNLNSILVLLGASGAVTSYAKDYMKIIICFYVFQITSFVLNSVVRSEGRPKLSMIAMLTSTVTNIILDYIFIAIFKWGVQGAAIATIIGQFSGFLILALHFLRGKSELKIHFHHLRLKITNVKNIFILGFATYIATIGQSIGLIFLNRGLSYYGGDASVTAMGAINSIATFMSMPIFGLRQGVQPIMGYNFGAKKIERVYETLKKSLIVSVGFLTVSTLCVELFPTIFLSPFIRHSSNTMPIAITGLRYAILLMPVFSITIIGITYFQSINQGKISIVLSMLRKFILFIPCSIILPKLFGLTGVWLIIPVSDLLTVLIIGGALIRNVSKDQLATS